MLKKFLSRSAARPLRIAALTAALLMLFSSCQVKIPDDTATQTEESTEPATAAQTEERTETAEQTETAAPTETDVPTESETAEPEPTETIPQTTPVTVEPDPTPEPAEWAEDPVPAKYEELTPINYDSPALLPLTADAGQEYVDNIIFLCDSPFYCLKIFGVLSDGYNTKQIWTGPEGTMTLGYHHGFKILDPVDNVERTIPEAAALRRPRMVVITVGINGVALWGEESFKAEYADLIGEIRTASPDTVILAQSILPISTWYYNWGMFTNAKITAANSWILEVAEQCGIHYLDTFSALVGEDGNIRPEYVDGTDGLHPNAAGLTAALLYIRTHAYIPN